MAMMEVPGGMVTVPAGEFIMGSDPRKDPAAGPQEQPLHRVTLDAFEIDRAALALFRAIRETGRRLAERKVKDMPVLTNWQQLIDYCHTALAHEKTEQFRILFLDRKNVLIADEVQQRGTIDHTPVYPREVIKRALALNAAALILVHNHPSGDPKPSREDIEMTREIAKAAETLGIAIHDHLVIGRLSTAKLQDISKQADSVKSKIASNLRLPTDKPLFKGKLSIFVTGGDTVDMLGMMMIGFDGAQAGIMAIGRENWSKFIAYCQAGKYTEARNIYIEKCAPIADRRRLTFLAISNDEAFGRASGGRVMHLQRASGVVASASRPRSTPTSKSSS